MENLGFAVFIAMYLVIGLGFGLQVLMTIPSGIGPVEVAYNIIKAALHFLFWPLVVLVPKNDISI